MAKPDTDLPNPEALICFALHAAARASEASYRPVLSRLGMTYPQYLVMLLVWDRDGLSLGDIGTRLHLESGTLTPLLKRLEARGWIDRRRDKADERIVRIHLTDSGRDLKSDVSWAIRDLVCRLDLAQDFSGLRDQVNQFRALITERMDRAERQDAVRAAS